MPLSIKDYNAHEIQTKFQQDQNVLDTLDLSKYNSALWLDLSSQDHLILDTGIKQIIDLSGNYRHPTQNTTTAQPEYTTILGLPCVRFNVIKTGQWMTVDDSFMWNSLYHIFAVVGKCGPSGDNFDNSIQSNARRATNAGLDWGWRSGTTFSLSHYNNDYNVADTTEINIPTLVNLGLNTTGKFIKINGYPVNQSTQATKLGIGLTGYFGRKGSIYHKNFIHEYIAFNRNLSVEDSNLIEAHLARKWNTTDRFYNQHPLYSLLAA